MKRSFFLLFLLVSCNYTRVSFLSYGAKEKHHHKYALKIPNGYSESILSSGTDAGTDRQYWYPDSSVIYISDFGVSLNSDNIEKAGFSGKAFDYRMSHSSESLDTLIFNGRDEKGFFWKEILIGNFQVGYKNINQERKNLYDSIFNSLVLRK